MQKKLIGAQISALLGAMPTHIYHSCGMTGERRDVDKFMEIKDIHFGHGVDKISGQEVHSPALIEFENGEFSVTTTGALAAGNLGTRMTGPEVNKMCIDRALALGCEISYKGKKLSL